MADHPRSKGLSSALCYKDSKAAFRWLEEAFGFEPVFVLLDEQGNLAHSEMEYGASTIMVGNEWSDDHRSPANLGGKNTQTVHVQLGAGEDIEMPVGHWVEASRVDRRRRVHRGGECRRDAMGPQRPGGRSAAGRPEARATYNAAICTEVFRGGRMARRTRS